MIDPVVLRGIPRFSGLTQPAEAWLTERARLSDYDPAEEVFSEGEPCHHFFMVVTGEVKVFKLLESGREVLLDLFRPGDSFGEVALLDGSEYPANAEARERSTVLVLSREDYLELLERFPAVARSIIRDLTLRMHALRRRVEIMGEGSVQARIAQLLETHLRDDGRDVGGGQLIALRLSRNELAGMVGARIETVIRIMSRWDKERIVKTVPEGFLVLKPQALHAFIAGTTEAETRG